MHSLTYTKSLPNSVSNEENRRWTRVLVKHKDYWAVVCYAVGADGKVADTLVFDTTGGQIDLDEFRGIWDQLWEMRGDGFVPVTYPL